MAGLSALPRNSLLDFYVAKTLEKLGRNEEAKGFFVKALDHDAYDQRAGDERNAMLKRVAASGGACVADLEGLFHKISYGGLPGFGEFTDAVHWRPSYNNAVWAELSRSAAACGIKGFGRFSAMNSGEWSETARRDAAKRLTYAVSWMGEKNINEASLAELLYVGEKLPGLLEQAAVSPGNIYKLIIRDLWPAGTAARLKTVFPFFLEHLAEHDRRVGKFDAALSLIQRAISLKPGDGYLRLEQAQVLAELGRMGEAGSEFLSLTKEHGVPEAEAFAFAYGFSASPQAQAVSPDKNGDKRLAPALSPLKTRSNDLIDLCFSAAKEKGKKEKALQACQGVVYLISSGEMPARPGSEMLGSNVSFQSCKLLAALGRMEEAQEVLLWTVDNAPASWPWLGEAQKAVRDPGYLLQAR